MSDSNKTKIILAVLGLIGGLGGAVIANWDKFNPKPEQPPMPAPVAAPPNVPSFPPQATQTIQGNNNVQFSVSNNVVNPPSVPKPCRDKSHGVERYIRTFEVEKKSPWMGGGYSQDPWCNDVISELRGQHPEATFEVIGKSEDKKDTCPPFNCPQYRYYCKVRVNTDPIYIEKLSSVCK